MEKICQVLNGFGVPASQIVIYDCSTGSTTNNQQMQPWMADFSQGAAGSTKIPGITSNGAVSLGGQTAGVTLPNGTNANCATAIASGTIDILVNIGVNKSHATYTGGMTLCLKNHFGTFAPSHPADTPGLYLAMNKSNPIAGGTPVRQQLCIIDSLWGDYCAPAQATPQNIPNTRLDRLVMGTFAGAVDYLTVTEIQLGIMNSSCPTAPDPLVYPRFLTAFNYATTDPKSAVG